MEKEREEIAERFFKYADEIGFAGKPYLEALDLGPQFMDEAMRRTRSRQDVNNAAAYFTTVTRNLLASQKAWKSSLPLEARLLTYIKNGAWEYTDGELAEELAFKGAEPALIERLLLKANEIREAA